MITYTHSCTLIHTYTYTRTRVHTYLHTHIHTHAHTHAHIHTCRIGIHRVGAFGGDNLKHVSLWGIGSFRNRHGAASCGGNDGGGERGGVFTHKPHAYAFGWNKPTTIIRTRKKEKEAHEQSEGLTNQQQPKQPQQPTALRVFNCVPSQGGACTHAQTHARMHTHTPADTWIVCWSAYLTQTTWPDTNRRDLWSSPCVIPSRQTIVFAIWWRHRWRPWSENLMGWGGSSTQWRNQPNKNKKQKNVFLSLPTTKTTNNTDK